MIRRKLKFIAVALFYITRSILSWPKFPRSRIFEGEPIYQIKGHDEAFGERGGESSLTF